MQVDYLIVGSGLFSAVFVEQATRAKKTCFVIDKRDHLGGNCYTQKQGNVNIHKYGCHIFHTDKKHIWDYARQFAEFNNFKYCGKVKHQNKIFSFPINLMTLQQVWGITTPAEAVRKISDIRIPHSNPQNMEDWCLAEIGRELYEIFIKGYTTKQWGKSPKDLPASIIKRLPIRLSYDENYYEDNEYQGIPIGGYTPWIENMFGSTTIELGIDFNSLKSTWQNYAKNLIYCGTIDEFYNYEHGELEYRSLKWETKEGKDQGCSVINHADESTPYTRTIDHKYFEFTKANSIISYEYPVDWKETKQPFYPINTDENQSRYQLYKKIPTSNNVHIVGRLGSFRYTDMDDTIALALKKSEELFQ